MIINIVKKVSEVDDDDPATTPSVSIHDKLKNDSEIIEDEEEESNQSQALRVHQDDKDVRCTDN
eukprot:CAMPEP_0170512684 /NCGR_PEP_ID=MMETSP0208-20121228/66985_1 /TAXON_ID=197538 /ORGANISM="Strombidium inclinatum, Strain S3" /LENGTH=63 /DNA_ID=CAMNT_0010796339 /DNA_START=1268 /DNA_END=1458 /DNA_ORIENTATION=+